MKFPSLFRTPQHQRFRVLPRYYDPIKEDIEHRTQRIRRELEIEKDGGPIQSSISGAFGRRAREGRKSSMVQLLLVLFFLTASFGYLYFGNDILYLFLMVIPVYLYFRLKRKAGS